MLRFAVFEDGSPARIWPARHAYVVGPDEAPIHGTVRFVDGHLEVETRAPGAAGVALQVPVDACESSPDGRGLGRVTCRTCLLPSRPEPYLLMLELARHRVMQVLNKLEEWALFDLGPGEEPMRLLELAREAFVEAASAAGSGLDPGAREGWGKADALARRALAMAMEAGEALAMHQAQVHQAKRTSGELVRAAAKAEAPRNALTDHEAAESRNALLGTVGVILPSPPQVGCWVSPERFDATMQGLVTRTCDFISVPMRWIDMEPTEGVYRFQPTDRWIEWAVTKAKIPITAGPVIDFRARAVPEWLYIWEHDYETLRELVYEHVKTIVTRYRRTVRTWTVLGGINTSTNFKLSFDQMMDLTRLCVLLVRKLQPQARIQVEIDQPWGEYASSAERAVPPQLFAEMITQTGLPADLLALRVEVGQPELGRSTRDMMALSCLLDRYAVLDKPIALSFLSAPSAPPEPDSLGMERELDPGYWRSQWSPMIQSRWMTDAIGVALSKPFVHSVCWHELYEGSPAHPRHDALVDQAGTPRPALARLAEIRGAIRGGSPILDLPETPAPLAGAGTAAP